jgi:hypothetical protein
MSRALATLGELKVAHWDIQPMNILKDTNENYHLLERSLFVDSNAP